jgi:hypothetical protein
LIGGTPELSNCVGDDVLEPADHSKDAQLSEVKQCFFMETAGQQIEHRSWSIGEKSLEITDYILVVLTNMRELWF